MSHLSLHRGRQQELPKAPPDVSTAVELYARKSGRTAKLHFVPYGGWFVDFELRPNDSRMTLWRDGKAEKPPSERVWLHNPNPRRGQIIPGTHGEREPLYKPLNIYEIGAIGVTEFLERGNTWSGRGEHDSVVDVVVKVHEDNTAQREKYRQDHKEANRLQQRETRRSRFGLPFVSVLKNLMPSKKAST